MLQYFFQYGIHTFYVLGANKKSIVHLKLVFIYELGKCTYFSVVMYVYVSLKLNGCSEIV